MRKLANWIKSYLDYTSGSEAPVQLHFWAAVSTLAGALRRNVFFDQFYFKWFPNFYIIFVAPPGIATKSTTIDIGMQMLSKIEGIKFGPESLTWQALISTLIESKTYVEYPGLDLPIPASCITISISEFGTFFSSADHKFTDHLVALWDGKVGKFEKATKTGGKESVENPWINIIGATTPSWMTENINEYMLSGGFISRCIFVFANEKRAYVAYPKYNKTDEKLLLGANLINDLEHISKITGEFELTPDAREFGEKWYENIYKIEYKQSEQKEGFLSRKQGHVHKLAMILTLAKSDELIITKETFQEAVAFIEAIEIDLKKVFASVGVSQEGNLGLSILQYIRLRKSVTREELFSRFIAKGSHNQIESAILSCIKTGQLRAVQRGMDLLYISKEESI